MDDPVSKLLDFQSDMGKGKFSVFLATTEEQRKECFRLRYDVFANEMGAEVRGNEPGIDKDRFDDFCMHLAVRENKTGKIIATTRLLDNDGAAKVGQYYSETEFDLSNVLQPGLKYTEVGRTCIHPDYRRGGALPTLWQGIGRISIAYGVDYLVGCPSLPLDVGNNYLLATMDHLRKNYFSPPNMRAIPRVPLVLEEDGPMADDAIIPTLLKGYLRQGAIICGEAYHDKDFNVADVFILVGIENMTARYGKKFFSKGD